METRPAMLSARTAGAQAGPGRLAPAVKAGQIQGTADGRNAAGKRPMADTLLRRHNSPGNQPAPDRGDHMRRLKAITALGAVMLAFAATVHADPVPFKI